MDLAGFEQLYGELLVLHRQRSRCEGFAAGLGFALSRLPDPPAIEVLDPRLTAVRGARGEMATARHNVLRRYAELAGMIRGMEKRLREKKGESHPPDPNPQTPETK